MSSRDTQRAFSLIEVVFALGIASFCLLLLLALLPTGMRTNKDTLDESRALQVASALVLDARTNLGASTDPLIPPFDNAGAVSVNKGEKVQFFYGYSKSAPRYILAPSCALLEDPQFLVEVNYTRVPQKEDADNNGAPDSYSALPVEAVLTLYWPVALLTGGKNDLAASAVPTPEKEKAQKLDLYFNWSPP